MKYFKETLMAWPKEKRAELSESVNSQKIKEVLAKALYAPLNPEDFLILLSRSAADFLEDMAQAANRLTIQNFGKAINIFTPLYISDVCSNQCRYCGFNANNKQKRRHMSVEEATAEAEYIANLGFNHILLLTGDAPKISSPEYIAQVVKAIKPKFASIGIEVYSLTQEEYKLLIDAGVDSMTMFQETYDAPLYAWLHPAGPKSDYNFRLNAPERAAKAGMRSIGVGALLGLTDFVQDAFATGLHAWWLQKNYPAIDISISIPRICPHEGSFEIKHEVTDKQLAQYVTALRCFLPRAGITCSSRENAFMRNHLLPLGVTRVSAGVSTAVGGRATPDLHNPGQFEISDTRSLEQMMADLVNAGYQPVLKDWEDPVF